MEGYEKKKEVTFTVKFSVPMEHSLPMADRINSLEKIANDLGGFVEVSDIEIFAIK